jgi:hypothetical protein
MRFMRFKMIGIGCNSHSDGMHAEIIAFDGSFATMVAFLTENHQPRPTIRRIGTPVFRPAWANDAGLKTGVPSESELHP